MHTPDIPQRNGGCGPPAFRLQEIVLFLLTILRYISCMKATITSKGQITIPIKIRRRLNLKPGAVLEFDDSAPYLKAIKAYSAEAMYSTIGCCRESELPASDQWLEQTRGPVELPEDKDADGN